MCKKCVCGWVSTPDPAGSLQSSAYPIARFNGPKGSGRDGRKREGMGGEGRGREAKKGKKEETGRGKGEVKGKGHTGTSFSPVLALLSGGGKSEWRRPANEFIFITF